jgi:hypothetical protein
VELWPAAGAAIGITNQQWQEDVNNVGGDRHSIVIQPGSGRVWETWLTRRNPAATPQWQAANGALFNLSSNVLRPDGWTSADAAGLCMLAGL